MERKLAIEVFLVLAIAFCVWCVNVCDVDQIEEDAYQEDLGFTMGTLGKRNSGRIRGPIIDSKTKAKISKTLQVHWLKHTSHITIIIYIDIL